MNTHDYLMNSLIVLLILSIALLLGFLKLYSRKIKRQHASRRNSAIRIAVQGEQAGPVDVPVRVIGDGHRQPIRAHRTNNGSSARRSTLQEPQLRLGYPGAELVNEITQLDWETYRLISRSELSEARQAAETALSACLKKLSADHWLMARLLNRLACIELREGENFNALSHLETANAVASEWPDYYGVGEEERMKSNLEHCHRRLGF